MPDSAIFAPVCDKGDKVYVIRSHRVRAEGGEYILATGTGDDIRHVIVNVRRAPTRRGTR